MQTGSGCLQLEQVQPESKGPMSAEDWVTGCAAGGKRASRHRVNMSAVTVTPIDGWNPEQYERFRAERRQPFDDLMALCSPVPGGRIVDLGLRHR